MTWQDAEVLTERLTRVWNPLEMIQWSVEGKTGDFFFCCRVAKNVFLSYPIINSVPHISLEDDNYTAIDYEDGAAYALCIAPDGLFPDELAYYSQQVEPFAAQWMNFFRRGCWLSGCPIEAAAHEKAEWMQGFSREEIEAWNLKM